MISPSRVEIQWKRYERSLVALLATSWASPIALTLLILVFSHWGGAWMDVQPFHRLGGFNVIKSLRFCIYPIMLLSFVQLFIPARWTGWWRGFSIVVGWAIFSNLYFPSLIPSSGLVKLSIPVLCFLGWVAIALGGYAKISRFSLVVIYLLSSVGWIWLVNYSVYFPDQPVFVQLIKKFWMLKPQLVVVSTLVALVNVWPIQVARSLSLSLLTIFRGIPWPIGAVEVGGDRRQRRELYALGCLNILNGFAFILFRMVLEVFLIRPLAASYEDTLVFTLMYYVAMITTNVGYLNIIGGILRISGFVVPDATNFKFLARTPSEFWRRGFVYLYLFFFHFIYLPIYSRWRNKELAWAAAFLLLFVYKVGFFNLFCFVVTPFSVDVPELLYNSGRTKIILFRSAGWVILMWLSQQWWFFGEQQRQRSPLKAWASIGLTHLSMMAIYHISLLIF